MLESIVSFFTRMLQSVRRGIRLAVDAVLAPFRWAGGWFARRGGIVKAVLGLALLLIVFLYGYFFWTTQRWTNFNPNYVQAYENKNGAAGQPAVPSGGIVSTPEEAAAAGEAAQTCRRSLVVDATADLVDFNVNQNAWISSMLLYKIGLYRHRLGPHTVFRQQGSVPARR